jgi:hypothetical protein
MDPSRHVCQLRSPPLNISVCFLTGNSCRINNKRLEKEFAELDSYLTSSSDSELSDVDESPPSSSSPPRLSLLQLADSLIEAANENSTATPSGRPPLVVLRFSRLVVTADEEGDSNTSAGRIARIIDELRKKNIQVEFGAPLGGCLRSPPPPLPLIPTTRVNLDLSMLIAFISHITHCPLPTTDEEVENTFRHHSRKKLTAAENADDADKETSSDRDANGRPHEHSRALTEQLEKERRRGLFDEILSTILPTGSNRAPAQIEFWTTAEARDRCLDIARKVGGDRENRRAKHLFEGPSASSSIFFEESRHDADKLPGLPVRIIDDTTAIATACPPVPDHVTAFFSQLSKTASKLLHQLPVASPAAKPEEAKPVLNPKPTLPDSLGRPRYTPHTLRSMYEGARRGWTTLSSNRASVRSVLREMTADAVVSGATTANEDGWREAALWVVEPRSLAEHMRA